MLDATNRMRRRLAGRLEPGEAVLAAASVHRLGTTTDALLGAAAAIATESGATTFRPSPSTPTGGAGGVAIDASPYMYLVVTSRRVMVLRRSALGRARDTLFEVPVGDVNALELKPSASRVDLRLENGRELGFETPKAPKFLPDVYRRLPELLTDAKRQSASA